MKDAVEPTAEADNASKEVGRSTFRFVRWSLENPGHPAAKTINWIRGDAYWAQCLRSSIRVAILAGLLAELAVAVLVNGRGLKFETYDEAFVDWVQGPGGPAMAVGLATAILIDMIVGVSRNSDGEYRLGLNAPPLHPSSREAAPIL